MFTETGIFPGPHSVFDVIQGVVPMEWATILRGCGISAKGVHSVAMKVGKYFVSAAHSDVWRPCCDAQVECEQRCLITWKDKVSGQMQVDRLPCRVCLRPWVIYITHAQASFCPLCQLSLATHLGEVVPPCHPSPCFSR